MNVTGCRVGEEEDRDRDGRRTSHHHITRIIDDFHYFLIKYSNEVVVLKKCFTQAFYGFFPFQITDSYILYIILDF